MKKRVVMLALGLTGLLAVGAVAEGTIEDALAQTAPPPAGSPQHASGGPEGGPEHGMHHDWSPSKHIEGRIAFLRTELKITPAQAPLFDALAAKMRADAKAMDDKFAKMHAEHEKGAPHEHKNLIDGMQSHIAMEQAHIQHANETLAVLKPLYASFTVV